MIRSSLRWLQRAFPNVFSDNNQPYRRSVGKRYLHIGLEVLEDRTAPSVTIAPTNNNGNGWQGLNVLQGGGFVPPDTQAAVGPTSAVEMVNDAIEIFNKSPGTTITLPVVTSTFFNTTGGLPVADAASFLTDPTVVYDDNIPGMSPAQGRFIVGAIDVDPVGTGAAVYDMAISKSPNPTSLTTADWTFFQIKTGEAGGIWSDYPGNVGYNQDAYVVSFNMFTVPGVFQHAQVDTINIKALLAGTPLTLGTNWFQQDVNDFGVRPAMEHDAAAGAPMWFVSNPGSPTLNVYKMTNVLSATPLPAPTALTVAPFVDESVVPPLQPNGAAFFKTDSRVMDVALRNNTLVTAYAVSLSATQDAARWYEIGVAGGVPALQQQGNVSLGNNTYADKPSIDINPNGDIGMDFADSGTGPNAFLSMYVTGRLATDPVGTMETPVLVPAGTGTGNDLTIGAGRIGDMSTINVDPVDGTFWAANEFTEVLSWGTAVANFFVTPPAGSGKGTLQISLDAAKNLVIQDVLPQGHNDILTIQSDVANSRYIVGDNNPNTIIFFLGNLPGSILLPSARKAFIPFVDVTGNNINITLLGGNDSLTIDNSLGAFTPIINFNGGPGNNTLIAPNQFNNWTLTTANAGNILNTATFVNVQNLVGGTNTDVFHVTNTSSLSGSITDHGNPGDTLDYSLFNVGPVAATLGPLTANNLQTGIASRIGSFKGLTNIVGDGFAANSLTGGSPPSDWLITGTNSGTINSTAPNGTISPLNFSNFDNLVGGSGANTFDFSVGGIISGKLTGTSGNNTLIGPNQNQTWNVTANNQGNLPGFLTSFANIQNLTGGGTGNNIFNFANATRMTGRLDGGRGNSWLNYSAFTRSMQINLATGADSAAGGGAIHFNNVLGSAVGGDTITGNAVGGVLVTHLANNVVTAGAGRTVIVGGFGKTGLIGGASDDLLINGSTAYDNNIAALANITSIWQSGLSYSQRIAAEQTGTTPLIVGATVTLTPGKSTTGPKFGKGAVIYESTLVGNGGQNWFITSTLSSVADRKPNEVVTT